MQCNGSCEPVVQCLPSHSSYLSTGMLNVKISYIYCVSPPQNYHVVSEHILQQILHSRLHPMQILEYSSYSNKFFSYFLLYADCEKVTLWSLELVTYEALLLIYCNILELIVGLKYCSLENFRLEILRCEKYSRKNFSWLPSTHKIF